MHIYLQYLLDYSSLIPLSILLVLTNDSNLIMISLSGPNNHKNLKKQFWTYCVLCGSHVSESFLLLCVCMCVCDI